MIDTVGGRVAVYSGQIADTLKLHGLKEVGDHLICQLELYVMVSLSQYFHFDSDCPTYGWIERVPSFSNPADAPSRFKLELAKEWFPSAEIHPMVHHSDLIDRLVKPSAGRNEGGKV